MGLSFDSDEKEWKAAIRECDIALENLRATIDAEETSPGERFEARESFNDITKERQRWVNRLEKKTPKLA